MTGKKDGATRRSEAFLAQRRFARASALQYLYQADQQDEWSISQRALDLFYDQIRESGNCPDSPEDLRRAWDYARRLIEGVIERRSDLDGAIETHALNWRLARMSRIDRNIMRIAAFELLYRDDIPDATAINESLELAKQYGDKDSARFVNGILDKLLKAHRETTE